MTAINKTIPGKRIKTCYRNWGHAGGWGSLRAFARGLIKQGGKEGEIAAKWFAGKAAL